MNSPSLMSQIGADCILVIGIKNSSDQLINPMDCLHEHKTKDESNNQNEGELICTAEVILQLLFKLL